jgi:signal transduction histidine kinase
VTEVKSARHAEAIAHCQSLDSIAIQTNNIDKHVDALLYTGVVYQNMGLTHKGLEYVLQAKGIANKNEFLKSISEIDYYLSSIYRDLGETQKSIQHAKMSVLMLKKLGNQNSLFKSYILLSNSFNQLDSIQKYLKLAESITDYADKLKYERAILLNNYAILNKAIGKIKISKSQYIQAIEICRQNGFQEQLCTLYNNYSYLLMAENVYDSIPYYLDSALALSIKVKNINLEASVYDSYSDYFKALGDFKNALAYTDKSTEKANEYQKIQRVNESLFLSAVFESEIKEKELLQQENQITRLWIFAIGFLAFFIAAFAFGLYYKQKLTLSKSKLEALEKGKALELAETLIKGQDVERKRLAMDLHDGPVASIGTLRFMVDAHFRSYNKYDEVTECILSIINQLREISHRMLPTHLQDQGLIQTIEQMVENVNKTGEFTCDFESNITGRLSEKLEINIYYLIFELINNAIKHSVGKSLFVQLIEQDHSINLSVEDDGQGFDQTKGHDGMGLKNIRTRIDYLSGKLEISSENNCTLFLIEIPLVN